MQNLSQKSPEECLFCGMVYMFAHIGRCANWRRPRHPQWRDLQNAVGAPLATSRPLSTYKGAARDMKITQAMTARKLCHRGGNISARVALGVLAVVAHTASPRITTASSEAPQSIEGIGVRASSKGSWSAKPQIAPPQRIETQFPLCLSQTQWNYWFRFDVLCMRMQRFRSH